MGMGFGGSAQESGAPCRHVHLRDGQWLTFATALPQTGPMLSLQFVIAFAIPWRL